MPFKLPKLNIKGTNIKEGMQRKYGTGEYARGGKKFEERMKPGESKFNYDVRMRKEGRRFPSTPTPYDFQTQERSPGDLRPKVQPTSTYQAPDALNVEDPVVGFKGRATSQQTPLTSIGASGAYDDWMQEMQRPRNYHSFEYRGRTYRKVTDEATLRYNPDAEFEYSTPISWKTHRKKDPNYQKLIKAYEMSLKI